LAGEILQAINEHVGRCETALLGWAGKQKRTPDGLVVRDTGARDALDGAGYAVLFGAFKASLLGVYRDLSASLGGMLSEDAKAKIRETIASGLTDLNTTRAYMVERLAALVRKADGSDPGDLVDAIGAFAGEYRVRLDTVTSTWLGAVANAVTIAQSTEGGAGWLTLDGPSDGLTRPHCSHFVGTRFTREVYEAHLGDWKRDPNLPLETLGGYNCRHRLAVVPPGREGQYQEGPR
jgi:hypothetical protein